VCCFCRQPGASEVANSAAKWPSGSREGLGELFWRVGRGYGEEFGMRIWRIVGEGFERCGSGWGVFGKG